MSAGERREANKEPGVGEKKEMCAGKKKMRKKGQIDGAKNLKKLLTVPLLHQRAQVALISH